MPKQPYVALSLALSLDGRLAPARGPNVRLGSPADLERLRTLRRWADTLIVGANTLRAIDPPMALADATPRVVVLSRRGELSPGLRAFARTPKAPAPWLVTQRPVAKASALRKLIERAEIVHHPLPGADGHIASQAILGALHDHGAERIVIEGGGQVAAAFLQANLIDELVLTYVPVVLGGPNNDMAAGVVFSYAQAPRFRLHQLTRRGQEMHARFRRCHVSEPTKGNS